MKRLSGSAALPLLSACAAAFLGVRALRPPPRPAVDDPARLLAGGAAQESRGFLLRALAPYSRSASIADGAAADALGRALWAAYLRYGARLGAQWRDRVLRDIVAADQKCLLELGETPPQLSLAAGLAEAELSASAPDASQARAWLGYAERRLARAGASSHDGGFALLRARVAGRRHALGGDPADREEELSLLEGAPPTRQGLVFLAAALRRAGRYDEARAQALRLLALRTPSVPGETAPDLYRGIAVGILQGGADVDFL